MRSRAVAVASLLLVGCTLSLSGIGGATDDAGDGDGGPPAAGDGGEGMDAGDVDAGQPGIDAGEVDAGGIDAGGVDAGRCDPESCDAVDDDCDGRVDEGGVCPCPVLERGGHHYLICTDGQSWGTARITCTTSGYDLVIIDDRPEHDWVWGQVSSRAPGTDSWLGLEDMATNGRYVWVDGTVAWEGGSALTYVNWRGGVPQDAVSEPCVEMDEGSGGLWADDNCGDLQAFVCETLP